MVMQGIGKWVTDARTDEQTQGYQLIPHDECELLDKPEVFAHVCVYFGVSVCLCVCVSVRPKP